jgi:hypothetical protein
MGEMTDPRVAALAEALKDHRHPGSVKGTLLLRRDHLAPWVTGFDCAAAVLAALPPDFCVAGYHPSRDAEIARLRAELDVMRDIERGLGDIIKHEDARLRKIEEAARAYIVAVDVLYRKGTREDWWKREATLDALRAALGEEP